MIKQTATIEIEIPKGNKWNVYELKRVITNEGIKCDVIKVFNPLSINKNGTKKHKFKKV